MDAGNTFAIVTAIAFLSVLPIALFLEGPRLQARPPPRPAPTQATAHTILRAHAQQQLQLQRSNSCSCSYSGC